MGDQNDQGSPPDFALTPVDRRYFEMVQREGQAWTAAEGGQWTAADQIPAAAAEGAWTAADQVASATLFLAILSASDCVMLLLLSSSRPFHLAAHIYAVWLLVPEPCLLSILISLVCRKEKGVGKTWQESKVRECGKMQVRKMRETQDQMREGGR